MCATNEDGYEAVYVNGQFVAEQMTFYMSELVRLIEEKTTVGQLVRIRHMNVGNEEWPQDVDELDPHVTR